MLTETDTPPQSNESGNNAELVSASQRVDSLNRNTEWYDRWKDRADFVSVALALAVFAAAALSNRLGAKLNRVNKELNTARERLNDLQIEKVRGDAAKDVENARGEAKERLEVETKRVEGEAGKKIEEARAEAGAKVEAARAEAARQVGEVQTEVERQRERAANAERALLEVQERLRPRTLTSQQRDGLLEILKNGPKGKVELQVPINDFEADGFALILAEVLKEAGWQVGKDIIFVAINFKSEGLLVQARREVNLPAEALQKALESIGFPTAPQVNSELPEDKIILFVGSKPPVKR
jgi:F0F1-type ATP synthase membrane subunit b/b'